MGCDTLSDAVTLAVMLSLAAYAPDKDASIDHAPVAPSIHSEIDLRKATRIFRVAFGGRLSAMGNQAVDRTTVIAVKPGIHHSLADPDATCEFLYLSMSALLF